jgi:hypothetical protein
MSAFRRPKPTFDLKIGDRLFPVKKTNLEKLTLFQNNPSLLGTDHYEVQTQVPVLDFALFVSVLEGGPTFLSEETIDPLQRLAAEFGFERLSEKCARFVPAPVHSIEIEAFHAGRSGVTLTVKDRSTRYEVLRSLDEIKRFTMDLKEAEEDDIVIDGIDSGDRPMENAVATVYFNTEASLPDTNAKRPFLALILWVIGKEVSRDTVDTVAYCLNLLHNIAPNGFEKARLILLSQCDPDCPDDFVPIRNADWSVISDAIRMLREQKHRTGEDAKALLRQLEENERYERINWTGQSRTIKSHMVTSPDLVGQSPFRVSTRPQVNK